MKWIFNTVNRIIYIFTRMLLRVHDEDLQKVPHTGPLIVAANHVNSIEVPILYTSLLPRTLTAFAKIEAWDNPFRGWLFNIWKAIPIRRGEADLGALKEGMRRLKRGQILAIAPEGTRSGDGRMQKAHEGIVTLAYRSSTPILPIVYYGGEHFKSNLARLRRTDFYIRVGKSFSIDANGQRMNKELRETITSEIMYQLAALLPAEYRGYYADLSKASMNYLNYTNQAQRLTNT